MAVKSGVHSIRLVNAVAQTLVDALLEVHPHLHPYPYAVAAWARAEARCLMLDRYVAKAGLVDETKWTVRMAADTARFERLAREARQSLGLDPRAEAELVRVQRDAVDPGDVLRGILEHGRRVMAEQAAIEAGGE